MSIESKMRQDALRRYLVFRVKAIEFLDVAALRQGLMKGEFCPYTPVGRTSKDFADSLRTVGLSWLCLFIDKSKHAMNVINLWKELFPQRRTQIEDAWSRMEPTWRTLRLFRDKAGFHADKPLAFFKARNEIVVQRAALTAALKEFQKLFSQLLKAESTELPDFEEATDAFLDEMERVHHVQYDRDEFKRYLMIHRRT